MSSTQVHPVSEPGQRALKVLLVEDSEPDALLLIRALTRGGFSCSWVRVQSRDQMSDALRANDYDLVLCDHAMPRFSAPEALDLVKSRGLDIPFIVVSGLIEEQTAVSLMKAGAHDYVMKDRLARLIPAVERELREAGLRRAQREQQQELLRAREDLEHRVEVRTADLRAANQKLEKVLEDRRRLENELLEIAENERRQIGFDLHDDLGQKLTGASLMIKGLEHKLAAEHHASAADASRIHSLIDQMIAHTHDLAHQFSSLEASGEDLCAVLQNLATNVKRMFKISCEVRTCGSLPDLPGNTLLQLQKIAQEAVSNAVKHGKATKVSIGLSRSHGQLVLTVKNDGLPFSPPPGPTKRMGLRIMNYRANTVGASLDIRPQKEGTLVCCSLPLNGAGQTLRRSAADSKGIRRGAEELATEPAASERP